MSFSGAVCTCENTENPRHCSEPKTYANKLPLPFSLGEALARRKSYNHFSLLGNYFGGDLNFEAEETKKISASDLIKLVKQIRVASSREGIFKIALGAKVANSIIEASHCPTTLDSVGKASAILCLPTCKVLLLLADSVRNQFGNFVVFHCNFAIFAVALFQKGEILFY